MILGGLIQGINPCLSPPFGRPFFALQRAAAPTAEKAAGHGI